MGEMTGKREKKGASGKMGKGGYEERGKIRGVERQTYYPGHCRVPLLV